MEDVNQINANGWHCNPDYVINFDLILFWSDFSAEIISDVPISLLLSSGLDSSIILHTLKESGFNDMETITIGFKEATFDESVIAKRFASDLGFKNETLFLSSKDAPNYYERMIYHLDALNANPCI